MVSLPDRSVSFFSRSMDIISVFLFLFYPYRSVSFTGSNGSEGTLVGLEREGSGAVAAWRNIAKDGRYGTVVFCWEITLASKSIRDSTLKAYLYYYLGFYQRAGVSWFRILTGLTKDSRLKKLTCGAGSFGCKLFLAWRPMVFFFASVEANGCSCVWEGNVSPFFTGPVPGLASAMIDRFEIDRDCVWYSSQKFPIRRGCRMAGYVRRTKA
jgi:hypothetical protein